MDDSVCPDSLEKIFLKVEQESERRAGETHLTQQKWAETIQKGGSVVSGKRRKDRQRGSISFSRIGRVTEEKLAPSAYPLPTRPATSSSSQSGFYETKNDSIDSIVSRAATAFSNDDGDVEDNMRVTQMHQIAGRPSISSKMLPRRLNRSHSASVITTMGAESNLMIGVSVQEATSESTTEDGTETISRRSSVQAPGGLPHRSHKSSIPGSNLLPTNWMSKVEDLMLKFRRKST